MDNEEKELGGEEEVKNTSQAEEIDASKDDKKSEEKENRAERLNSYLFALNNPASGEIPNVPNPETAHNEDKKSTKKLLFRLIALAVAFAMAFWGAFAGVSWVCRTAVLGDSDFFTALVAKYSGIAVNKAEVDYISGEYTGDTIALGDKVKQCTVVIRVVEFDSTIYDYTETASGSGVILEQHDDGTALIVTNHHVVHGAKKFFVQTYSGEKYDGEIMHLDETGDLAIVKIQTKEKLATATVADSDKAVSGQQVVAAGNPLGLGMATSFGYVAANDRNIGDNGGNVIQLDISANPGNSGGGLYDTQGNLLGIITSKASGSNVDGIVYAIPSNRMLSSVNDLLKFGYVRGRPALGITVVTVNASTWDTFAEGELKGYLGEKNESRYGVYILSSKYTDQLQKGDRIVSFNGDEVSVNQQILNIISKLSPGSVATLVIERQTNPGAETPSYLRETVKILLRERDWADEIPK
ncbi:MAG: trypsin-like serine protease [Ruminococcaceae bacterium]|nr:trypsin-like serine protease [Oscillospiraceae bacterium]